jgi:Zn-finger nucleic acid-binding protein
MALTDEEWIAEARRQLTADGNWSIPMTPAAKPSAPAGGDVTPPGPICPICADRRPLAVFARRDIVTAEPLRYCERCYGFWAAGDALSGPVASPDDEREPLYARPFPARCATCGKRVYDGIRCRRCAIDLPRLHCPACGNEMERFTSEGVTLDSCAPCKGTWFDVGELGQLNHLTRPEPPASGVADLVAANNRRMRGVLVWRAIGLMSRVVGPFGLP